jgi:hypothetical protein
MDEVFLVQNGKIKSWNNLNDNEVVNVFIRQRGDRSVRNRKKSQMVKEDGIVQQEVTEEKMAMMHKIEEVRKVKVDELLKGKVRIRDMGKEHVFVTLYDFNFVQNDWEKVTTCFERINNLIVCSGCKRIAGHYVN